MRCFMRTHSQYIYINARIRFIYYIRIFRARFVYIQFYDYFRDIDNRYIYSRLCTSHKAAAAAASSTAFSADRRTRRKDTSPIYYNLYIAHLIYIYIIDTRGRVPHLRLVRRLSNIIFIIVLLSS